MARRKTDPDDLHSLLRGRMKERRRTGAELAHICCLTPTTFSTRMVGRTPWTSAEMYAIMDALEIEHSDMYLYFPPGGVAVDDVRDTNAETWLRERGECPVPGSTIDALKVLINGLPGGSQTEAG